MSAQESTVHVVDDDASVRQSLRWLIESVGMRVRTHASAAEFLAAYNPEEPGCLVLDVRMPGISGLELQDRLRAQHISIPVIIITGHGDVPMAVRALKSGAMNFLEKPFSDQMLLEHIQSAITLDIDDRRRRGVRDAIRLRVQTLSPREHDVMMGVVTGKSNKTIAQELDLSPKTVEVHRARVMDKMQAGSLAELVRLVNTLDDPPASA